MSRRARWDERGSLLIFPKGVAVRPEELNKFFRPLLTCIVLRAFAPLSSIEALLP
jgi:hypothetical protein